MNPLFTSLKEANVSVRKDKCCILLELVGKWGVFSWGVHLFRAATIEEDAYSMSPDKNRI